MRSLPTQIQRSGVQASRGDSRNCHDAPWPVAALCLALLLLLPSCMSKTQRALQALERNNIIFSVEEFVASAGRGDLETIDLFLNAGMDPDTLDVNGYTALMLAAEQGNIDTVKLLLERKASPNVQGIEGATALIQAAFHNRLDVLDLLLASGADASLKDEKGWTPFMKAVYQGHTKVVERMMSISADQHPRALMVASIKGHPGIVRLLLAAGVSVDQKEKGQTALMMAASRGNEEIVRLLLNNGAQPLEANAEGRTASMIAMVKGHKRTARLLQEAEAGKMPAPLPLHEPGASTPEPDAALPSPSPEASPSPSPAPVEAMTPQPSPVELVALPPSPEPAPSESVTPSPLELAPVSPTPPPFDVGAPQPTTPSPTPDATAAGTTVLEPSASPTPDEPPPAPEPTASPSGILTPEPAPAPSEPPIEIAPAPPPGANASPTPYAQLPEPLPDGGSSLPRNTGTLPEVESLSSDLGAPAGPVKSQTMRLIEFHENQLPIILTGVESGIGEFRSLKDDNQLVYAREGDTIPGTSFRVISLRSKRTVDKKGSLVDASEARVRDHEKGAEIRLVIGLPARAAQSYAVLAVQGESEPIKVRENEEFTLPGDASTLYRVLDLRETQAVIQVVDTGETLTVMK